MPDGEKRALALMVAGTVGVRLSKVSKGDWSIDRANDRCERNLLRWSGENVTPADTTLGADQPRTLECKQDLLKVWLRQTSAICDLANRNWAVGLAV